MDTTVFEKRELHVTEVFINEDVTLVYMPELHLCDFYVKDPTQYVVHFLDPRVFGEEFATIHKGNNLFNVINSGQTQCYLFDDAQLRDILTEMEHPRVERMASLTETHGVTPSPCTGPIIIPPGKK